jgi:hypothetical protein
MGKLWHELNTCLKNYGVPIGKLWSWTKETYANRLATYWPLRQTISQRGNDVAVKSIFLSGNDQILLI